MISLRTSLAGEGWNPKAARLVGMFARALAIYIVVLMPGAPPALAQVSLFPPAPSGDVVFLSVANHAPELKTGEALVTHPVNTWQGTAARSLWPASYFFRYTGDDGKSHFCSGTLVGPTTLLTAAHCVPSKREVTLINEGTPFKATCTAHPEFDRNGVGACVDGDPCPAASDIALCSLKIAPVVQRLEVIDRSTALTIGARTLISGFGCTNQSSEAGGSDDLGLKQVVTAGWAAVGRAPSAGQPLIKLVKASDIPSNLPTVATPADSQLCPGDSGSASYAAPTDYHLWDQRKIIGVNSFYLGASSYVVSLTSSAPVRAFLDTWPEGLCGASNVQNSLCGRAFQK